jgi:PGF-pre-PGF domain-containing protein
MFVDMPVRMLRRGEVATVDLVERKLPTLKEIKIIAEENAATPKVSVIEEIEAPPGVPELQNAISYLTIDVDNARGMSFVVGLSKARIENLEIDVDTLKVHRLEDNWAEVSVEKVAEDEDYIYFEVTTPGFSLFAVSAEPATLPTLPIVQIPPAYLVIITAIICVSVIIAVIWRYISIGTKSIPKKIVEGSEEKIKE